MINFQISKLLFLELSKAGDMMRGYTICILIVLSFIAVGFGKDQTEPNFTYNEVRAGLKLGKEASVRFADILKNPALSADKRVRLSFMQLENDLLLVMTSVSIVLIDLSNFLCILRHFIIMDFVIHISGYPQRSNRLRI